MKTSSRMGARIVGTKLREFLGGTVRSILKTWGSGKAGRGHSSKKAKKSEKKK